MATASPLPRRTTTFWPASGSRPASPCNRPPGAGPTQAPVEIWVHHKLTVAQEALVKLLAKKLERDWARIKPKVRLRIERHSPEVAKLLDEVKDDVQLRPLAEEPDWHVVRFSRQIHAAKAKGP